MNGHLPRSLPSTPSHHGFDPSRPPPCPREMYSTGMYAAIDDHHQTEHKKPAPPPPKRDPGTRLSTTSIGSNSSATYEELSVCDAQHHHQYHPHHATQSPYNHQDQGSRPSHGSPHTKSKFFHEPQSPQQAGNQPFSYMSQMSPKLARRQNSGGGDMFEPVGQHSQNINGQFSQHQQQHAMHGHGNGQIPSRYLTNGQNQPPQQQPYRRTIAGPEDNHVASPATSYGKHESVFHPQPHSAPPKGPPPPPPGGQPMPMSPKLTRHSVTTLDGSQRKPMSPIMTSKLSQRSQSVPNAGEAGSLPEPPPPLSVKEGYMAAAMQAVRPPSPPLPPPPPEMLNMQQSYHEPPPPDATYLSVIQQDSPPHPCVSPSYHPGGGHQYQTQPPQPYMGRGGGHHQQVQGPPAPPPPPPINTIPSKKQQPSVTPPRGANPPTAIPQRGANPPNVPLMNSQPRASMDSTPSTAELLMELNKVQLKRTGLKTVTPDPVPESPGDKGNVPVPVPGSLAQQAPPPQAPPTQAPPQQAPPQHAPPQQAPPSQAYQPKPVEIINNNNRSDVNRNKGQGQSSSSMEIDLDDIDVEKIPGYVPITKATPVWKRDMIEKKNQEKIEEYVRALQKQKQEQERWKNVPAWKRRLMEEKEKQKTEQELQSERQMREEEERRREQARMQKEREMEMEEELKSVPAWKREIMMKRGGAIKNWGDEREEINEGDVQDGENGDFVQRTPSPQPPPPPQPVVEERSHGAPTSRKITKLRSGDGQPSTTPVTKSPAPSHTQQHVPDNKQPGQGEVKCSRTTLVLKRNSIEPNDSRMQAVRPSQEEQKILEDWDNVPLWKREVLMKRGGAPTNWGDEREDANDPLP